MCSPTTACTASPQPPRPSHSTPLRSSLPQATHPVHNAVSLCPNGEASKEAAELQRHSQHISGLQPRHTAHQ